MLKSATLCASLLELAEDLLRELPAVDRLLAHPRTRSLLTRFNREYVVQHCRQILDELRSAAEPMVAAAPAADSVGAVSEAS